MRYWPLLIILFPALELYVLIQVGSEVGALATIGLVILAMMAGLSLLRMRGAHILARFQEGAAEGRIPPNPVFDTLCLMAAGWLFIFPGFVSDVLALALLFPVSRQGLVFLLKRFMLTRGFGGTVHTQTAYRDQDGNVTWTSTVLHDPPASGTSAGRQTGRLAGGTAENGRAGYAGRAGHAGQGQNPGQVIIDCDVDDVSAHPGGTGEPGGPDGAGGPDDSAPGSRPDPKSGT